jgi:hypothetical protein
MVEVLPNRYAAWAHESGRFAPAAGPTPRALGGSLRVAFPSAGQRFVIDLNVSRAQQELVLRAEAAPDARLTFVVDGGVVCQAGAPFECAWRAERGRHELRVRTDAGASARVAFEVE